MPSLANVRRMASDNAVDHSGIAFSPRLTTTARLANIDVIVDTVVVQKLTAVPMIWTRLQPAHDQLAQANFGKPHLAQCQLCNVDQCSRIDRIASCVDCVRLQRHDERGGL